MRVAARAGLAVLALASVISCRMPPFNTGLSLSIVGADEDGSATATATSEYLLFRGLSSDLTVIFDEASMTSRSGPSAPRLVGSYAEARNVGGSGPWSGTYWIFLDNGNWTMFFDPAQRSFIVDPAYDLSANFGANSHSWTVSNGPHAGEIMIFFGGGTVTSSERYEPDSDLFDALAPDTGNAGGTGPRTHSFVEPQSGNRVLVIGESATDAIVYDPFNDDFPFSQNFSAGQPGPGSHAIFNEDANQTVTILLGGGSDLFEVFDPTLGTFSAGGFALPNPIGAGAHSLRIPDGPEAGKYLVISGGGTGTTAIYDPAVRTAVGGPPLAGPVGTGSSAIPLKTGPEAGKYLIVHGGGSDATSLFDPQNPSVAMPAGPTLVHPIESSMVIPLK